MSFSAGPVSEEAQAKALEEKHVGAIRTELAKMGRVMDPFQMYKKFIGGIRYEFGIRGFLMSQKEAVKLWDEYYLPRFLAGK